MIVSGIQYSAILYSLIFCGTLMYIKRFFKRNSSFKNKLFNERSIHWKKYFFLFSQSHLFCPNDELLKLIPLEWECISPVRHFLRAWYERWIRETSTTEIHEKGFNWKIASYYSDFQMMHYLSFTIEFLSRISAAVKHLW